MNACIGHIAHTTIIANTSPANNYPHPWPDVTLIPVFHRLGAGQAVQPKTGGSDG